MVLHRLLPFIGKYLPTPGDELRFVQDWLSHSYIQNTVVYTSIISTTRDQKARSHFMKPPKSFDILVGGQTVSPITAHHGKYDSAIF